MIYILLFVGAFLYFVVDRKVRLAILPGIFVTLLGCYALVYRFTVLELSKSAFLNVPSDLLRLTHGDMSTIVTIYTIPLLFVVSVILVAVFLFLGKAVGRVIFNPAKDGKSYNVISRILYIAASVLTAVSGLYFVLIPLLMMRSIPGLAYAFSEFIRAAGHIPFRLEASVPYGAILVFIGILCTVLICTKIPFFRTLKAEDPKKIERLKKSGKNPLSIIGFIFTGIGLLGILIITIVCLIQWQRVFFFDGYTYTQIISAFLLLFLIIGIVFLGYGFGRIKYQKKAGTRLIFLIASLILIVMSMACIIWLVSNAISAYVF